MGGTLVEKYVLGVDAAWTSQKPSGVALLKWAPDSKPVLVRIGRSYDEFCCGEIVWENTVKGSTPNFSRIVESCLQGNLTIDVVALDIPLSPLPINGRREADRAISRKYGRYGASTRSPSPKRPGGISVIIFKQLSDLGFTWANEDIETPAFIEVYPHVAIIELFGCDYRFPYKVQKRSRYWPKASSKERTSNIILKLNELRNKLASAVANVEHLLPELENEKTYLIKFLKSYEDLLDVVLSALVGCYFLDKRAIAFGDNTGVIWVPNPD